MLRFFAFLFLGAATWFGMMSCDKGGEEKIQRFECEDQFQGEACFRLGAKREGEEALRYYRMGCERQSTNACGAWKKACEGKAEGLCAAFGAAIGSAPAGGSVAK